MYKNMTVEQIKNLFLVKADGGNFLTSYRDNDDILNFHSDNEIFVTNKKTINRLREITKEENEKYLIEKNKKLELLKETQGE